MSSALVEFVLAMTIGCAIAAISLLAVWAALSNRYWALRGAALIVPPGALCLVTAYTPAIFSTVLLLGVIIPLNLVRRKCRLVTSRSARSRASEHRRFTFSIKDVMLMMALAAGFTAVLVIAVRRHLPIAWPAFMENAFWYSAQSVGVSLALIRRWRFRAGLICVTLLIAVFIAGSFRVQHNDWLGLTAWFVPTDFYFGSWMTHLTILVLAVALTRSLIEIDRHGICERFSNQRQRRLCWTKRCVQCVAVVLSTGLVGYLVWIGWLMAFPPAIPEQNRSAPNRFEEVVSVSSSMGNVVTRWDVGVKLDDFNKWVQSHQSDLTKAHALLNGNVYVPLDYTPQGMNVDYLLAASEMRELARAFIAEGITFENSGELDRAVKCYLDVIRLGQKYADNGLLIQYLVGFAIEGMGIDMLVECREKLDRQQCQALIEYLATAENAFVPLDETYQRDYIWSLYAFGWFGRLCFTLEDLCGTFRTAEASIATSRQMRRAAYRMLIVELAIRIHQMDRGEPPLELADLVPLYLDAVPNDPLSAGPFIYRTNSDGSHVLYSVGRNAVDDGGVIVAAVGSVIVADGGGEKKYAIPSELDALIEARWYADEERGDYFLDQSSWLDFDNELKYPTTDESLDGEPSE